MHKFKRSRFWSLLLVLLLCCLQFSAFAGSAAAASNLNIEIKPSYWGMDFGSTFYDRPNQRVIEAEFNSQTKKYVVGAHYVTPQINTDLKLTFNYAFVPYVMGGNGKIQITFGLLALDSDDKLIKSFSIVDKSIPLKSDYQNIPFSGSYNFTLPSNTACIDVVFLSDSPEFSGIMINPMSLTGYDMDEKIIEEFDKVNSSIVQQGDKISGSIDSAAQKNDENQKTMIEKIKELPETIGNKLTELFVPNEQKMQEIQDRFKKLLEDHLGFLYEAPQLVKQIFENVSSFSPSESPQIVLPAFDFTLNGTHVHLWDSQTYKFDFLNTSPWSILYGIYKTFIFVMLAVAMINLGIKKYHSIIGGS